MFHSGEFRLSINMFDEPPSQARVDQIAERAVEVLLEESRNPAYSPEVQQGFLDSIKESRQQVQEQLRANTVREVRGIQYVAGPMVGGDTYTEFRIRRSASTEWSPLQVLLERDSGVTETSIHYDAKTSMVTVNPGGVSTGFEHARLLGRILGASRMLSVKADDPTLEVRFGDPQTVDDRELPSVELWRKGAKAYRASRVVIDAARDYVCPLVQDFHENGQLAREWRSATYETLGDTGLLFPRRITVMHWAAAGNELRREEWRFENGDVTVNGNLDPRQFSVSIPADTVVVDGTGRLGANLVSTTDVSVAIDDVPRLPDLPGLVLQGVVSQQHAPTQYLPSGPWGELILIINGILMLCVVLVIVLRRKGRSKGVGMLLVLVVCADQQGCGSVPGHPIELRTP